MSYFKQAKPVWANEYTDEMNIMFGLRALIHLEKKDDIRLHIASSGVYRIYVNGEFFGHGPARGPHGFYRVDEMNLSDVLKEGDNIIAIEVACYQVNSFYLLDQLPFIQGEIFCNGKSVVATGQEDTFEAKRISERVQYVQRYSFQRPFIESYELESGYDQWRKNKRADMEERVLLTPTEEKKLIDRRVSFSRFQVCDPEMIISKGSMIDEQLDVEWIDRSYKDIGEALKGYKKEELVQHVSHDIQRFVSVESEKIEKVWSRDSLTSLSANEYVIYEMPLNNTGFIGTEILCEEDLVLHMTFDEIYDEENQDVDFKRGGCVNALRYKLKKGSYQLESLEPYTFKYLKVWTSKACVIRDVYLREYVNADIQHVAIKTNNPSIDKIYEAGLSTFAQNAVDIYMDCPGRERAGWLCDSFFTSRVEKDLTGKSTIEKNFLENYLLPTSFEHLPEGMLPMCYPADHNDGVFIPNWAMWFIIELEEYLHRTGDKRLVMQLEKKVYGLFNYLKGFLNEDGLLEGLEGWIFVEWSKCNSLVQDVNYPSNMVYAASLKAAGRLFDDEALIEEGLMIEEVIRQQAFKNKFFADNAIREEGQLRVTDEVTETCQYYAFFFGIATKEKYPELYDTMINKLGPKRKQGELDHVHISNAFIGNYLRLEVLSMYNEHGKVMEEIEDYFLYMANRTGTLWENITTNASCNHGFASHVIRCIHRDGAGIREINSDKRVVVIDKEHMTLDAYEICLEREGEPLTIRYKEGQITAYDNKGDYLVRTKNVIV